MGRLHAPRHGLTRPPPGGLSVHVCLSVCLARVLPSSPVTCDCCVSWTAGEATALSSLLVRSLLPPLPATSAQALSPLPPCPVSTEPPEPASGLGLGVRGTPGPAGTSFSPAWASGSGLAGLCLLLNPPLRPGLHWCRDPPSEVRPVSTLGASSLWQGKGRRAGQPAFSRAQHTLEAGKGLGADGSLGLPLQANPSSSAWQWLCEPQTEVPSSPLATWSLAASISPEVRVCGGGRPPQFG